MTEYEKLLERALKLCCENSIYHQNYDEIVIRDLMNHWINRAKEEIKKT